jgi:transcriptional regulator with GAF, ATPase, and Fis domain
MTVHPPTYAEAVSTVPDHVSDALAAITVRLAARHDALSVLRAVADACGSLLSADAAGILVADPRGGVAVAAASDDRARFAEFLQAQTQEGPCLDCIAGNAEIAVVELAEEDRWPRFTSAAQGTGFRSIHAFPMRLASRATGGINMFFTRRTELSAHERRLGQALADLAVLGLTQERDERRAERLVEQTLTALNDRVTVSHAVGMLAGALSLTPDDARALLTSRSKSTGRPLSDLARAIIDGSLTPDAVAEREDTGPR